MRAHFIAVSRNAKTGPIPASIIERASCWPGCALYENACYAETGALALHWDRVSQGVRGGPWSEFCTKVAALRPGRLWRYAQAGDLPGYGAQIDGELLSELVAANAGKQVIAFTHKHVLGGDPVAIENRRLIATAIKAGFMVNLSADNPRMRMHWPSWGSPRSWLCSPELTHAVRFGTDTRNGATSGPRRLPNGGTGQPCCRGLHQSERGLRSALRPTRTPRARAAAPAPEYGMLLSVSQLMVPGEWLRRPLRPGTCRLARAGHFPSIARWPRSSPRKQQPDAFTLPICAIGRVEALEQSRSARRPKMSFKPEVQTDDTGKWYGNALRFGTREEAEAQIQDLMMRWFDVRETRVVECDDPVNYRYVDGRLEQVGSAIAAAAEAH
jgi:hypothetical protein